MNVVYIIDLGWRVLLRGMIPSSSEGLTILWSFSTQLFHQGSTLVLELGPHKDNSVLLRGFGAKKGKMFFTQ